MPTTATYSHYYGFGSVNPLTQTVYPVIPATVGPTTLEDDLDLTDEGMIAAGASVSWTANTSTTDVIGVTDAGYPVLYIAASNSYFVLTNANNLHSTPLVTTATT